MAVVHDAAARQRISHCASRTRRCCDGLEAIHAETQLLYSSDWPHWDFDVPARVVDLPFLSDQAKRNILGENARTLFRLDRSTCVKAFDGGVLSTPGQWAIDKVCESLQSEGCAIVVHPTRVTSSVAV